jgi:hypothetical protein
MSIGEAFEWIGWPAEQLGAAAAAPAFHRDGLALLLETVFLSRPVYVWDAHHRRFALGPSFVAERGSLADLRHMVTARGSGTADHVSKVLHATLT